MISIGHEHSVAITHHGQQFRIFRIIVDQLNTEGGIRHIEIDVHFFEHRGVLVRRPAGPVSGIGLGDPGYESAGFNVFSQQHLQVTRAPWSAGRELQSGVLGDLPGPYDLQRVAVGDVGGKLRDVHAGLCRDGHGRVAGNINRVVPPNLDVFFVHCHDCLAPEADQSRLPISR